MKSMKITLVLTLFLLPSIVFAYPRFGALAGEKCSSCHFQASGGGIRTERGNLFAAENLMMKTFQEEDYSFDPQIKEGIRLGGDLRTMNYYDSNTNMSDHIQMEGILYGNYSLSKSVDINLSIGFNNLSEIYGRFRFGKGVYVKAGLFIPDYGIRIPDHRSPIRLLNKLDNYGYYTGIELGYNLDQFDLSGYIGDVGNLYSFTPNKGKMGIFTARFIQPFGENSIMIGGSVKSMTNAPATSSNVENNTNFAVFASLGLSGKLTILGQFDFMATNTNKTDPITAEKMKTQNGKIAMAELSYVLTEGLHFRYQFDFYDPSNDVDDSNYYGHIIGIPMFFATGFELEPMLQLRSYGKNIAPIFGSNKPLYLLMAHFYF